MNLMVDDIQFKAAGPAERRTGLLGWASFRLDGSLEVNGVTVRHTRDHRITISFPARYDRQGNKHFVLRPLHERARRAIERQLLDALGIDTQGGNSGATGIRHPAPGGADSDSPRRR